ncbi:glutathione S-transferase D7-like isoform X3 [Schistocerca cancellata]|uniref:glutathione S-transferase D7-like isoform X3 n=1 Tax=Schistocerca cancellata TaxID=274614 RepID=UPI002119B15F|nr:glutathione S-transferase D7-like isoform X3 [Schistocerca cancellata]
MPIVLYHFPVSPPCRTALCTAKALGLDVTIKIVNLFAKEHLSEDFIKMNPEHIIPSLDDNGLIIWHSHAIATYLVSKYGKDDSLYPKDPAKRVLVDQRLYFDATTLFPRLRATTAPLMFLGKTDVEPDKKAAIYEALGILEKYLEPTGWVAGDHVTVADIACAVTTATLQAMGVVLDAYPKIKEWLQRCNSNIPHFEEENKEGLKEIAEAIKSKVTHNIYAP